MRSSVDSACWNVSSALRAYVSAIFGSAEKITALLRSTNWPSSASLKITPTVVREIPKSFAICRWDWPAARFAATAACTAGALFVFLFFFTGSVVAISCRIVNYVGRPFGVKRKL